MSESMAAAPPPATRNLRPISGVPGLVARANRWAIVVGISTYEHERLNLKYAHRDAEELYKLLQTPSGGGFEPERMVKMINEEATTAEITRALRSFLKKPAREDVVLLYFACHGSPDVDRPNIVYLLTHDTDPDDISGTALPMREIDLSLKENLLAEKVVIIADTCHSASIGGGVGRRGATNDAGAINAYLEQVSAANGGLALLTSAEASETAQEGKQWGDGHGVFTYYLLKGLRGEADGYGSPKDGVVSVGELFDYVRENVKRATNDQQHAAIGTAAFDRSLPMAITGGVDARVHHELGTGLLDLGWRLDDRERFLAAAQQFSEAIRLSRMARSKMPEAELGLGEALLAAGHVEPAVEVLEGAVESGEAQTKPYAFLLLGVARAILGADERARDAFKEYVDLDSEGTWAAWARLYLSRPERGPGRTLALLIGINRYRMPNLPALKGCVNDVRLMHGALIKRAGLAEEDVTILIDEQATKDGIVAAFTALSARARPSDAVIVHFSGHSISDNDEVGDDLKDLYLIASDTVDGSTGISPEELHRMMNAIPSQHKTIVLDTHPHRAFNDLAAAEADYWVLLASDSAQIAYESSVEHEGLLVTAGLFTGALTQEMAQADVATLTFGNLVDGAMGRMRERGFPQVPVLIGVRGDLVFGTSDVYIWATQFALRRTYPSETIDTLRSRQRRIPADLLTALPALGVSFGRAYLEHGAHDDAVKSLKRAVASNGPHRSEARRLLARAQVTRNRLGDAGTTLAELARESELPELAEALRAGARKLAHPRRRALLVGIDRYQSRECPAVAGAVNDVRLVKECLVTRGGFRDEDVTVLVDDAATREAILHAFRRLSDGSSDEPALFYFAGIGSNDPDGNPTLVSSDGRTGQISDIGLPDLAVIANDGSNLVTVLDAGFLRATDFPVGSRSTEGDSRERPAGRDVRPAPTTERRGRPPNTAAKIGLLTVYNLAALEMEDAQPSAAPLEGTCDAVLSHGPEVHGYLTYGLVRGFADADPGPLSYRQWVDSTLELEPPVQCAVVGEGVDEPVFQNHVAKDAILATLSSMDTEPVGNVVNLLLRLIAQREEQDDHDAHARLNLGVAYAAMGECEKAIEALERAISYFTDETIMRRERERDPRADDHLRDAHYQLGRVLYECGTDFTKATSQLNEAVRQDPTNARAHYYLGQSIRLMVEHETLAKAVVALTTYLTLGAPLGHENEVREFLGSRKKATVDLTTG